LIPLYGFLEGDVLGLLILASEDETVLTLAHKLQQAAALRVAPPRDACVCVSMSMSGEPLDLSTRVGATGLQPLDRFDVRFEVASARRQEPSRS
jgi:hypothetical protein